MREMNRTMAEQYLQQMMQDGWTFKPIFGDNGYVSGKKEGYSAHIDIREKANNDFDSMFGRVSIWNEKDLWIEPSYPTYNWEQIKKNELQCDFCNEYVDKVYRVGFANKACDKCYGKAKIELEVDGWDS